MLLFWFIRLKWKETVRSSVFQRNLAANIGIGFLILLMVFYLLLLGIFMDELLLDLFPDRDPEEVFNSILIYYFLFDLFWRYLMQKLPVFSIESYLHLPIRRAAVAHFILLRTGLHILNFLPLFIFIPFAIKLLALVTSPLQAAAWLASLILLVFTNGFIATLLKRQLVTRAWVPGLAALLLILIAVLDYAGLIRLTTVSLFIFNAFLAHPWLTAVPAVLLCLVYVIHYRFLLGRMYPEEVIKHKTRQLADIPRIKYLESMGLTGDIIILEMKLWWRHKRTRTILYMLPIFVLYGFFFYPQPTYREQTGWLIFVGIFMTGGFTMNYLNYAFGYESNYFDGILTRKIDMNRYINAKLTIAMLINTFCFIITVPYFLFGPEILLINLVTYLFNMGFISFLLLYMATYNKLRMDLSKGSSFNYQGIGAMNWLVILPAFLLPVILYAPFGLLGLKYAGLATIALTGITGFMFRKYWVKQITKAFFARKYIMAEGFRG